MTVAYIKLGIYTLLGGLILMASQSEHFDIMREGIRMVWTGQCFYLSNQMWGWVGLEHPFCTGQRYLVLLVEQVVRGKADSIAALCCIVSAPILTVRAVDRAVSEMAHRLNAKS